MKQLSKINEGLKLESEKLEKISIEEISLDTYTIYLCNMCNWQATKLKNSAGQVVPIYPTISKTCNSQDSQTCINQGAYLPILNCGCSDTSFTIQLYLVHPRGYGGWTNPINIVPDCGHAGEIIPMNIPDPA
ncbi:hypothetical protein HYN48_13195 [Flavobacterium magnum]|uniref:Uncharacterized protein n=1 Tax=Flavobacterium magnum TaxID=2162713 RepID=A0A2S0RH65_9FLAO|nr:hypothetical protein [Flavobacterium magnum]AWA30955.1 hypothetical protein HYN48_13195 [Flavobacterium magnum]